MFLRSSLLLPGVLCAGLAGLSDVRAAAPPEPLAITASSYPIAYFAQRIAGSAASVLLPVPVAEDPAFWRPSVAAVREMQRADQILLNGAGLEKWQSQVTLPALKLIDTSAGFKDRLIMVENAVTHSHGVGGTHSHSGLASTTWLDFELASRQAETITSALVRRRPTLKQTFEANRDALMADLASLDRELARIAEGRGAGRPLMASHPVYQYLARRYGLNLNSVHWEPNEMPGEGDWIAFKTLIARFPAKWMIWEGQPDSALEARLKAEGVGSVVFDPCANRPESGDFLSVMRQNVQRLAEAYR